MKNTTNLKQKTVFITGGNTGIGLETAKQCALWGANVVIASRDEHKCQNAVEIIEKETGQKQCEYMLLDLADFNSIKHCAEKLIERKQRVDYFVCNAGVMVCPYWKTKQGFEMQTGTNHMGHFMLLHLLFEEIKKWHTRVIITSSLAHTMWKLRPEHLDYPFDFKKDALHCTESDYDEQKSYAFSKFLNIIHTKHLQKMLSADKNTKAAAYALHPGSVMTELQRHAPPILIRILVNRFTAKTAAEGAATTLYLIAEKSANLQPGGYYCDCKAVLPIVETFDEKFAEKVWDESTEICTEFLKANE